ncbi:MAG: hypothetical protein ACREQY_23505, partial [Candidatus Binatia bacterium]
FGPARVRRKIRAPVREETMKALHRTGHGIGILVAAAALLPACSSGQHVAGPSARATLVAPPPQVAERVRDEMRLTRDLAEGAPGRRLDLKVERLWSENGATWATVSVRNTASFELVKITVDCTAFGPDETTIDVGEQTLHAPAEGPMGPGAAKTMKILVGSHEDLRSMSCEARAL